VWVGTVLTLRAVGLRWEILEDRLVVSSDPLKDCYRRRGNTGREDERKENVEGLHCARCEENERRVSSRIVTKECCMKERQGISESNTAEPEEK
jgi:hypothetical protein